MTECFDCCYDKLCGFQNLEQSLKNYPLCPSSKSNFADKECYIISAVSKIQRTFVHKKEIRQPNYFLTRAVNACKMSRTESK